jgi:hypothetical protein
MSEGRFTIPTRVFLTAAQREKLFVLAREHDVDLPELLTELLVSFIEHLPDYTEEDTASPEPTSDQQEELRLRHAELRRLRARAVAAGDAAPRWLTNYIADLEREVGRLEGS